MPENKNKANSRRNNISEFFINISAEPDGSTEGVIEHCQSGAVNGFESFIEMVLLINEKLDEAHFPQSANEMRVWADE